MTIYANNVAGTMAANIGPSDTAILLGPGQGAAFPSPSGGDYFWLTLAHFNTGAIEVVQCTERAVDTLTVVRGRDSTNAISFVTGSVVEMRLVAAALREIDYRTVRGQANGLASLDASTRIPAAQMPTTVPLLTGGKLDMAVIPDAVATDTELALKAPLLDPVFSNNVTVTKSLFVDTGGAGVGGIQVGNDAMLKDVNVAHTLGVISVADSTKGLIRFGTGGDFGWNGTYLQWGGAQVWHSGTFNPAGKLDVAGGTMTGDLTIYRASSPSTGVVFLGNLGNRYLYNNGSSYELPGQPLNVGGIVYGLDFQITSDRRAKKNVRRRATRIGIADHIRLYDWQLKDSGVSGVGPLAQHVQVYAPEYVGYNGIYLTLDKAGLALEAAADLALRVQKLEKVSQCSTPKRSKRSCSSSAARSSSATKSRRS